MSSTGSISEFQPPAKRRVKLPGRFQDRGGWLGMTTAAWELDIGCRCLIVDQPRHCVAGERNGGAKNEA
jgi:hypothetical protein